MSLKARILQRIPERFRHTLIRESFRIPSLESSDLTFKIATTQEELEAAFSLLHDCYVGIGIMKPHPSGMRCTLFTALPYTTTIIAKYRDQVVGTVSLIRDSPIGFPSDKEYRAVNDSLRKKGHRMLEVSALATHRDFRTNHRVSLNLMNYLYHYSTDIMGCDTLCIAIHPRAYDFYAGLIGFQRNGEVVRYGFANGALAIHMSLDLNLARTHLWPRMYPRDGHPGNFREFFAKIPGEYVLPSSARECAVNPVMTPEMLEYFFVQRTSLFSELDPEQLGLVGRAYSLHFDLRKLPGFAASEEIIHRPFRYPTKFQLALLVRSPSLGERLLIGNVSDLSTGGIFLETTETLPLDASFEAMFNFGDEFFRIPCSPQWRNPERKLNLSPGYGLRFHFTDLRLVRVLKGLHLNQESLQTEGRPLDWTMEPTQNELKAA